jgi:hypothetical protein
VAIQHVSGGRGSGFLGADTAVRLRSNRWAAGSCKSSYEPGPAGSRHCTCQSDSAAGASEFVNQSTFMHQSGGCSKNDRLGSRRSHDLALRRQIWPPEQNATSFFSQTLSRCLERQCNQRRVRSPSIRRCRYLAPRRSIPPRRCLAPCRSILLSPFLGRGRSIQRSRRGEPFLLIPPRRRPVRSR